MFYNKSLKFFSLIFTKNLMDNFIVIKGIKSLLVRAIFIEALATEIKKNKKNDPYLENLVSCEYNSSINAAEAYLKELKSGRIGKKLSENEFDFKVTEAYLINTVEKIFFEDQIHLNELLIRSRVLDKKGFDELLSLCIVEIKQTKDSVIDCEWLKDIKVLPERLDKLVNSIQSKFNDRIDKNLKEKKYKLKWNLEKAAVCTLFSELALEIEVANGKCAIASEPDDIVDFIVANFLDVDGNPFTFNTVKGYVLPSQKKAKRNRLDLALALKL